MKYIFKGKSSRPLNNKLVFNYPMTSDNEAAYTKAVPFNAIFGRLKKIGGKTVAFNQLVNLKTVSTQSVTTNVSTGEVYYVNTDNANINLNVILAENIQIISGHKYYVKGVSGQEGAFRFGLYSNADSQYIVSAITSDSILSFEANYTVDFYLRIYHYLSDGKTNKPVIFDLTQMFGAGNEPTLEECEAIFVNDYYAANAGELKSAAVNKVVIGDLEKAIPATVQALDGYGWSAGDVVNTVEWENGRAYYHKRVGKVTFDNDTDKWFKDNFQGKIWYNTSIPVEYEVPNVALYGKGIMSREYTWSPEQSNVTMEDKTFFFNLGTPFNWIFIRDDNTTNKNDFLAKIDGVTLYYELAEEVVTDITNLFPRNFDYFSSLGVETITFENNLDGIYLPIPNEEEYYLCDVIPSSYKRVEYIESTGTQYIDTLLTLGDNFEIDLNFALTQYLASAEQPLVSTWTSVYGYFNLFVTASNNMKRLDLYVKAHKYLTTNPVVLNEVTNVKVIRDGNDWNWASGTDEATFSISTLSRNNTTLKVFKRGDLVGVGSSARLYSLTIKNEGETVADFVPCYRLLDNEIGLYDLITKRFFTNAGTGEFIIPT